MWSTPNAIGEGRLRPALPPHNKTINNLPKAELHLHIEGTLEPELMLELARRNRVSMPYRSLGEARRAYKFQDLGSFLELYYRAMGVLLNEADFYDLTKAYLQRAAKQGVTHAEIFFDPQAHTGRKVPFEAALNGIHRALSDFERETGTTSKLIMCFLRDQSKASAQAALDSALSFKDWIFAVGLDSKEIGNPPRKFEDVFKRARKEGFLAVAHAGEEAPASYVWEALRLLKVSRVDHGYRSLEDPGLVKRLATERIPLTTCPLASVGVGYFGSLEEFPIRKMLDMGLIATVNSDDPAYFGGYVSENYDAIRKSLGLGRDRVVTLLKNSFRASFLDEWAKKANLRKLQEKLRTWP